MSKWCNYQPSPLPDAKEVFSWPCSALGGPECRSVPQEPCLGPTKGEQTLLQPSETLIPPHLAKHVAPDNKKGVSQSVEIHVVFMNADSLPSSSPLCLQHSSSMRTDGNFSAKCKDVKKMSEKDSSVATFSNLNWQVKRNINCLFMSSPPTADWCRIQFKVALKCKVGVIICLKYFSSF